jgi:hypothetical protein
VKLRSDKDTFLLDPASDADATRLERYRMFTETFVLAEYAPEMSKIFGQHPDVRSLHSQHGAVRWLRGLIACSSDRPIKRGILEALFFP